MESLCYSANKGSDDAYDVSTSLTSSAPTVSEIQIRGREDGINSDTSPVPVSNLVDDRSGQPEETTIERGKF